MSFRKRVGLVAVVGLFTFFQGRPNTFESDTLKITYASSWAVQDKNELQQCREEGYDCQLVVADARFGSTAVIVARFDPPGSMSPSEIAKFARNALSQQPGVDVESMETVQVDGLEAVRFFYSAPMSNEQHYGMELYVVKGNWAYEITVESANAGIFREKRKDIDAFIEGMDFL